MPWSTVRKILQTHFRYNLQIPVVTRFNRPKQLSLLHIFPPCSFKIWRKTSNSHTSFGNKATFHLSWYVDSYNIGTWGRNKPCAITEDTQESKVQSSLSSIHTKCLGLNFTEHIATGVEYPDMEKFPTSFSPNEKDHLSDWGIHGRIILKRISITRVGGCKMYSLYSEYGPVVGTWGHGKKPPSFTNSRKLTS